MNHTKSGELYLHIPEYSELDYRQKLLSDPETMSYNKGYDVSFAGYERETGCIAFEREAWKEWYGRWSGNEPERFYAYVMRAGDDLPVGEVCLHHHGNEPFYEMGVVIEAKHRGRGYGLKALNLLLEYAFENMHVKEVHNSFEETRKAALAIHRKCGFEITEIQDGILQLACKREKYLRCRVLNMERRKLSENDIPEVLCLYRTNPQYFRYCPPEPDESSVLSDMTIRPEGCGILKHYYGWYEDGCLCTVSDLLENYPEMKNAWIGLFMMHAGHQCRGLGHAMIERICEELKENMDEIRLGCMENNIPGLHFWKACGFETYELKDGIVLMKRKL